MGNLRRSLPLSTNWRMSFAKSCALRNLLSFFNHSIKIPLMPALINYLSDYFKCKPNQLLKYLNHPFHRETISNLLKDKQLMTLHLKRNKKVKFSGLTFAGSDQVPAYESAFQNMSVYQHFFGRHRLKLMYYSLPC